MLLEGPARRHQAILVRAEPGDAEGLGMKRGGDLLSDVLLQRRLRIEQINVAGSALHEAPDHGLCPRRYVGRLGIERVLGESADRGQRLLVEHRREGDRRQAAARLREELAAARDVPMVFERVAHTLLDRAYG